MGLDDKLQIQFISNFTLLEEIFEADVISFIEKQIVSGESIVFKRDYSTFIFFSVFMILFEIGSIVGWSILASTWLDSYSAMGLFTSMGPFTFLIYLWIFIILGFLFFLTVILPKELKKKNEIIEINQKGITIKRNEKLICSLVWHEINQLTVYKGNTIVTSKLIFKKLLEEEMTQMFDKSFSPKSNEIILSLTINHQTIIKPYETYSIRISSDLHKDEIKITYRYNCKDFLQILKNYSKELYKDYLHYDLPILLIEHFYHKNEREKISL